MNIYRRFIVQFLFQIIIGFILLLLLFIAIWGMIGFSISSAEIEKDLSNADSFYFSGVISMHNGKAEFDDKLKVLAKKQGMELIVFSQEGRVAGFYNTAVTPPEELDEGELASLVLGESKKYSSFELLDWEQIQPYYLLIRKGTALEDLLAKISMMVDWDNQQLKLTPIMMDEINKKNEWVQFINSSGEVVDDYAAEGQPNDYTIEELSMLSETEKNSVSSHFDNDTGQAIIAGTDGGFSAANIDERIYNSISQSFLIAFLVLFLLLLIGTVLYARKFGIPLITMMKWIKNLGDGIFEEPQDLHQQSVLVNKKGKLKKKYRLYKDFILALHQLTKTLKDNESERLKMTKTREEWISGISHDLKTPLASIAGYSQMLKSPNYSWSEQETKEFGEIITDKSAYMMDLLEDLTLTYRLRNQALPIVKEEVDLNEFIRRTIIYFVNDPNNRNMNLQFNPSPESISAHIDPKWFQRILDNLIQNAIKYNPAHTSITVSVSLIEQHFIVIKVEDDGIGMDQETLDKLFQRYYRGTNTSDTSMGTGLGMAIAKQLVQLHDGTIQVNSTRNKGTFIRILIPAMDNAKEHKQ
ncbi:sensor histidine kinase [Cytobacillus gottheilii]|uniref:sensor histidine kinase n=1 Tax=Cytobacillus gottheilii TaxID=859144 RepID=UPI0009B94640|nr:HAMP domain-containing sensor histidine kinase [Cytobacillus gottheilii]